ncbi:type I restriction-modification system subunit M [Mongoliitalea lutea]|uniref:site-specific DNA-methyltransferase (adenine-specific) n=1 Tax=Mongoliitalea lutea TaxID=849756 RepID=A0A8J3CYV0_9BACT|nr:class I SAM-dependent DNA methyltransferase [Mongoliitalea lutea]GHB36257.1 restriction endonuclease subunit M [Mongoliitalea lutea]
MQAKQLRQLEAELWKAADQLRANSKLTASEYSMPVLGLIFLRHAYNRFLKAKEEVEASLPFHPVRGRRPVNKKDFEEKNAMFLPEQAQFEYLVSLPESAEIGEAIDHAMKLIEDEYDNLKGVLPKNFSIFSKDLLRELLRIFNKEVLQKAEGDLFGKIYEYFLNKFAMTGAQEGGEFFTPMSLVQTIVNVIEPDHGIVFDPACGSAGMFVQTGYFIESEGLKPAEKVTFYGQEKAELNTKLAKMNLAVHGLEGNIQEGNTFYEDKHDLLGNADFVMANPPFNVDGVDKGKDAVKKDPRLILDGKVNLPKNDNANYLWIQYFYNYLTPTGRAGFVMASSASDAGHSEKDIREKLVKTGAVDVMMAIGNNFFYTRSLPCTLWFYDRAKEKDEVRKDQVLMLDARKIFRKVTSKINDFSPEQLKNIICIVNLYRGNTRKFEETIKDYLETSASLAKETAQAVKGLQEQFRKVHQSVVDFAVKLAEQDKSTQAYAESLVLDGWDAVEQQQEDLIALAAQASAEEVTLEAVAHGCKQLRKQQDKLIKQLLDAIGNGQKEFQLMKNKDWKELGLKDQLDLLKALQQQLSGNPNEEEPGLLHETEYFYKQAHWLTSRFPEGVYTDVEGLCKVVTQAEIEAKDWSLSPGRYVGVDTATDDDFDYEERLNEIHIELDGLNEEAVRLADMISENYKQIV